MSPVLAVGFFTTEPPGKLVDNIVVSKSVRVCPFNSRFFFFFLNLEMTFYLFFFLSSVFIIFFFESFFF